MASNKMKEISNVSTAIFANPFDQQYSSFEVTTMAEKKKLYNSINNPSEKIADHINMRIDIVDVVLVKVKLSDRKNDDVEDFEDEPQETKTRDGVRTILIDKDGVSYNATSNGIFNSVQLLKNVFGTLHFEEPLGVIVKQIATRNGNTLTLEVAL